MDIAITGPGGITISPFAQLVLGIFLVIVGLIAAKFVKNYWIAKKGELGHDWSLGGQLITVLAVFMIGAAFLCPAVAGFMGMTWAVPEAAAPPTGPIVTPPTAQAEGYVLASVKDTYKIPTDLLSSALVYVSQSVPVANDSWIAIAQENTSSAGSVLVEVPGVTSGTVYVTGYKSGYYSDYVATTIPGAQVMPSASQTAALTVSKIGDLEISQYDNNNCFLSGAYIYVDNDATSAYITLDINVENVYCAIKDIRILEVRGDDFSTTNDSIAPVIISNGGLAVSTFGDPTLTNATTGGWDLLGELQFGNTLRVKWTIATTTTQENQTLARISTDDLGGLEGYLGESGITENILYIQCLTDPL